MKRPGSFLQVTGVVLGLAVVPLPAGELAVEFAEIPRDTDINLTAEGTLDWVHWGLYTETSVDRKAGVTPQIGDFEVVYDTNNPTAWAFVWQESDHYNGFSWSDGTPTVSVTDTRTFVWVYGVPRLGAGFRLSIPADQTRKTLKVYVGVYSGSGLFTAHLSDASAPPYQSGLDSTLQNLGNGPGAVYTIQFAADSASQDLIVTWTLKGTLGPGAAEANVTLQAAALSAPGVNNPPSAALTAPGQHDQYSAGTAIELTARASDLDGSINQVEFFDGDNKLGQATSEPYAVTWNNASEGWHTVLARATDDQGATGDSMPVEIFVYGSGGALIGSLAPAPAGVDLSSEGTADWAHWGLEASNSVNRKAGVTQQIGGLTVRGADPLQRHSTNLTAYSWSDGLPVVSEAGTLTGVFQTGLDGGFELSVPADTTPRRVRVYAGLYGAEAQVHAYLSDFSAPAFADSSVSDIYHIKSTVYTIDYRAARPGVTLLVRYRPSRLFDLIWGNMRWQAVTLSTDGPPPPAPVTLLEPVLDSSRFAFSFLTETSRWYEVQSADSLGSGWQPFTNVAGTGGKVVVSHPAAGAIHRFYRVAVQ